MRKSLAFLAATALAAAILLGAWVLWLEPDSLRVRSYRLELPGWTAPLAGLRVALLADLHIGAPFIDAEKLERIVERTNAARPDLILIPGDMVVGRMHGARPLPLEQWVPILAGLSAPLGVYGVMGNQDWASIGDPELLALRAAGIVMLEDESLLIGQGEQSFRLVGISDLWFRPHDVERAYSDADGAVPILALTHNPDLFPQIPPSTSLTIAGHSHGGQVWLPLIGPPLVQCDRRYTAGHVIESDKHLFVHTGIGTSLFPARFNVPPEIAILQLFPFAHAG